MRYRKKPVEIEAVPIRDVVNTISLRRLPRWVAEAVSAGNVQVMVNRIKIHTLEGVMVGLASDMLIRGVQGEPYACRGDIFDETYEAVE